MEAESQPFFERIARLTKRGDFLGEIKLIS